MIKPTRDLNFRWVRCFVLTFFLLPVLQMWSLGLNCFKFLVKQLVQFYVKSWNWDVYQKQITHLKVLMVSVNICQDHSRILFSICKNTLLFLWLETRKHNSENKNNSTQLHIVWLCHFLKKVIFSKELFKSYFSLKSKK